MSQILTTFLGSGWKAYAGGVLLILGSIGLGADFLAEELGMDVFTNQDTTWTQVVQMFGLGLVSLGIRHKQDTAQAEVLFASDNNASSESAGAK